MSFCNPRTQAGTAMGRAVKGVVTRKRKGVVFARWTTRGKRHEVQLGRETDRQAVQMELSRLHARLAADPDYGPRHTNELICKVQATHFTKPIIYPIHLNLMD